MQNPISPSIAFRELSIKPLFVKGPLAHLAVHQVPESKEHREKSPTELTKNQQLCFFIRIIWDGGNRSCCEQQSCAAPRHIEQKRRGTCDISKSLL